MKRVKRSKRIEWTEERKRHFDQAVRELGGLEQARAADLKEKLDAKIPNITEQQIMNFLSKSRDKAGVKRVKRLRG